MAHGRGRLSPENQKEEEDHPLLQAGLLQRTMREGNRNLAQVTGKTGAAEVVERRL